MAKLEWKTIDLDHPTALGRMLEQLIGQQDKTMVLLEPVNPPKVVVRGMLGRSKSRVARLSCSVQAAIGEDASTRRYSVRIAAEPTMVRAPAIKLPPGAQSIYSDETEAMIRLPVGISTDATA